jgi:AcrR family transcriptional regulator
MVQRLPRTEAASPGAQDKRLQILREAAEVFRARGFHRASMEEIADRLGMHKGNLYYYFPSKHDLLYFCQEQALDRLTQQAQTVLAMTASHADRLRTLIECHLVCVLDELGGSLAHAEFEELPALQRRRITARRDRYEAQWRQLIQAGMDHGAFRRADPKLAVLGMLGALNWSVKWHRPSGGQDARAIAQAFATLVIDGIREPNAT